MCLGRWVIRLSRRLRFAKERLVFPCIYVSIRRRHFTDAGGVLNTVENREVTVPLGIVVERRKSTHPWGDWIWSPVAVFMNGDDNASWVELMRGDDYVRYHAATLPLRLHRKETESLRFNLMLDRPELYVILQQNEDQTSDFPYEPHVVTASSYEAQDFQDAGDYIIEKVAMPEGIAALIQAFVEEHHVEDDFQKRRRDKLDVEDLQFGKTPIYTPRTRQ
jgi:hypothetical protein